MKIKYGFAILLALLVIVSLAQIAPIPPHADDLHPAFRSGYFGELERSARVVTDAFLAIKTMSRPEYAWVFLVDTAAAHDMKIDVFDYRGCRVSAPGEKTAVPDAGVLRVMDALNPSPAESVSGGRYRIIIPLPLKDECRFCHQRWNDRKMVGAIRIERSYDAHIYYSRERIIIFTILAAVFGALLYAVVRWDPGQRVKELFDK